MSEAASSHIYVRPRARDLGDVPLDLDLLQFARLTLKPRELGVWLNLRTHLWVAGGLPTGLRPLARIADVGPASLEKMMPVLAPLFDRDATGRWRDLDLEEERARRLDLQPGDDGAYTIDPKPTRHVPAHVSEARRQAGSRGGRSRVEKLKLIQGGRADDAEASGRQAKNAGNQAKPQANADDLPAGFATSLPSFASAQGESLSVCLLESNEETDEQTDRQTSKRAPAGAGGEANDAARGQAKPSTAPQANGEAKPSPGDAAIVRAIVGAYDRKVDEPQVPKRLPDVREAIAKGCSLALDIVPECKEFSRNKATIENCFNIHVRSAAFARRDVRLRSSAARPDEIGPLRVYQDDPALVGLLEDTLRRLGRNPKKVFTHRDIDRKYTYVDREQWQAALAAERAAREPPP